MEETDKIKQKSPNQEFDYFKIAKMLLSRWYWIALTLIVCYIAANVYLLYTPKTYMTSANIKLEDKKSEIGDVLSGISGPDKNQSKVQSETFIIQSRSLILSAVKHLNYPISFYIEGRVRTVEVYPNIPLHIKTIQFDTLNYYHDLITFKSINQNTFNLTYKLNGRVVEKNFQYNTPLTIGPTTFIVSNTLIPSENAVYLFKFNNPDELVNRIREGLRTNELIKNSNILLLQQTDSNPAFAADALNAIMDAYTNFDLTQKQLSASQIITFINKQLDTISEKVKQSETSIENYKINSKLMEVSTAAEAEADKANDIEAQRSLLKIQLNAINEFKKQVSTEKENVAINFAVEGNPEQLNLLIANYNMLLADRTSLLKTYIANSQPIEDLNYQISSAKNSINKGTDQLILYVNQKIAYLDNQLAQINQKIATFPLAERELLSLNRDFEINEKVYSLLSEKNLDAQISRSAILPGATIIEKAQPNFVPVSPNESEVHRTAIIIGIIIGLGFIFLVRVLNPYIYDKETVESLTTTPIIGVIRKFHHKRDESGSDILVLSQPKSVFAESVRAVRTNLSFLASEKKSKVVCITSEVAGEGKSFVAVNLSSTLSLIDKKIILIAADLRRSKLHKTFHVANDKGLSNYLAHQSTLEEIIIHTNQENFDFIPSGPVPPNPSELLHTERMRSLIETLRLSYDIIMIDTAPVGLVSDSIPLVRLSDINVFVLRAGKSKFYAATIPQRIAQEYNLNNSVIVLNAFEENLLHSRYYTTKFAGGNYSGGKYYYYSDYVGHESSGYYIDDDNRKWWDIRRWFK